ncbi:MAG: hypothetical protein QM796_21690 [Chthoniobacteraceae bacterium]
MHALLRKISPYTAPDILLGVFSTAADAQRARGAYLAQYLADPSTDPWHVQAYKSAGLKTEDLHIVHLDCPASSQDGDEIIVASNYEEMFGQIYRELDSVHLSEASARNRIAEIEQALNDVPSYALLQHVRVGSLASDKPDEQPHL